MAIKKKPRIQSGLPAGVVGVYGAPPVDEDEPESSYDDTSDVSQELDESDLNEKRAGADPDD